MRKLSKSVILVKISPERQTPLTNFLHKIWYGEGVPGLHLTEKFHHCGFINVDSVPSQLSKLVMFGIFAPKGQIP